MTVVQRLRVSPDGKPHVGFFGILQRFEHLGIRFARLAALEPDIQRAAVADKVCERQRATLQ